MKKILIPFLILVLSSLLMQAQVPPSGGGSGSGDPPIGGDNPITISAYGNVLTQSSGNIPIPDKAVSLLAVSSTTGDTSIYNTYTNGQGLFSFTQIAIFAYDTIKLVVFDNCDFSPEILMAIPENDTNLIFNFEICTPSSPVGADPSWFNYSIDSTTYIYSFEAFSNDNRNYYHWDFGDGITAEEQNTTHLFDFSLEETTVTLYTAFIHPYTFDTLGKFYLPEFIDLPSCHNYFTYTDNGQNNFSFEGYTTPNMENYTWDFGDGNIGIGQTVNHTYEDGVGEVEVSLTTFITDPQSGCYATSSQTIYINTYDCENYFTYDQNAYFFSFEGYSNPEADIYIWDMGDGTELIGQEVSYLYTAIQNEYTVSLTTYVIEPLGDTCVATSSQIVVLEGGSGDCENYFTYTDNGQNSYTFEGFSTPEAETYEWAFSDNTFAVGPITTHTFDPNLDEVTVTLTTTTYVQNDTCIATATQTISLFFVEASFHYELDSLNITPNTFLFYDETNGIVNSWNWDFNNGNTSTLQNPTQTFEQGESYYICLNSANEVNSDTYCTTLTSSSYYNIGGLTLLDYIPMNSSVLTGDTAIAYLFMKQNNKYQLFDTLNYYENGYFYFTDVLPTDYFAKIQLTKNSEHYGDYLPSYYGNSYNWINATILEVGDSNQYNFDINLPILPEKEYGNGSISGNVLIDYQCNGAIDILHSTILLKNANHTILRYTECNENGTFSFDNLPLGDYYIEGDIINLYNDLLAVSLTDENPQQDDLQLEFVCENPNGFIDINNQSTMIGEIYPNPVKDYCKLTIQLNEKQNFTYSITSIYGKEILSKNITLSAGKHTLTIPLTALIKGSYLLSINGINTNLNKHQIFIK